MTRLQKGTRTVLQLPLDPLPLDLPPLEPPLEAPPRPQRRLEKHRLALARADDADAPGEEPPLMRRASLPTCAAWGDEWSEPVLDRPADDKRVTNDEEAEDFASEDGVIPLWKDVPLGKCSAPEGAEWGAYSISDGLSLAKDALRL